ncbi:MAG: hypothetical protein ACK4F8_11530 [Aquabacterium sp.]
MSHDQGRPSLFAGMEDGAAAEPDTQRVRILSTLESTRRVSRPARKGGTHRLGGAQKPPVSKVWLAFFGVAALALMTSFVTVLRSPEPAPTHKLPVATGPAAPASQVATSSLPPSAPASAAVVAMDVAPTASAPASAPFETLEALPPTAASSNAPSRDPMAALKTQPSPDASVVAAATAATGAALAANKASAKEVRPKQPSVANASASTSSKRKKQQDSEVALIEAVMTHGSSRPKSK